MLDNLLKYGLRLTLLHLDYLSIIKQITWADFGAIAALVGHVVFVLVCLWTETAGVEMVKKEHKVGAVGGGVMGWRSKGLGKVNKELQVRGGRRRERVSEVMRSKGGEMEHGWVKRGRELEGTG